MLHAFISDGRLLIRNKDGELREIESHFVREKAEHAEQRTSYIGWKSTSSPEDPYWGSMSIWGNQAKQSNVASFRFKAVVAGEEDTIYYILTNSYVTGLFEYTIQDDEEVRLFHKNNFVEFGLDFSRARRQFVIAVQYPEGRVNLQLLDSKGSYIKDLTCGDSRDSNPAFSLTKNNYVLYQSSGIARNDDGMLFAYGPESICRLNLDTGEISQVLSDDNFDYLLPKNDREGNIFCIRRPHQPIGRISLFKGIVDVITFPFRFVIAIVGFMNAFTELFGSRRMKLNGPNVQSPTKYKYVNVLGRTINLAKIRRLARSSDSVSLVPGSWELIKLATNGGIETVARKVSSYDIDEYGNIHCTNGFKVSEFVRSKPILRFRHKIIENLRVVKSGS